ncbi:MAG: 1-acyl-sn-glycerol-3-phosphate acyltransferase [Flavobacteriales bacterium]|nr:MAG: 1-acyl-sn-glycerol-3-phosphate acyltransferase [Flavobacteriales bacterium]
MQFFKKSPFGHFLFIKRLIIQVFGLISHQRYRGFNQLKIEGSEIIRDLPDKNVLFVSNHQTYFADVAAMLHVFNASLNQRVDSIKHISYLWRPKLNIYFVAAVETMKSGLLPKIFAYVGSVSIERTWRSKGQTINRQVKMSDIKNISIALNDGWLITFPQGTTTPFKPIRRGTAHIIKTNKPIVVPVVIDGFRRAYDKKGLLIKKRGILQSMVIKPPLEIDYDNESVDEIVGKLEMAIEQHPSFLKVTPIEEYQKSEDELNKKRTFTKDSRY